MNFLVYLNQKNKNKIFTATVDPDFPLPPFDIVCMLLDMETTEPTIPTKTGKKRS